MRNWERLRLPLLPPSHDGPHRDDRTVIEGILWRLTWGVPWRDLPARFDPWKTVYSRFRLRHHPGFLEWVLGTLQADVGPGAS